MYRLCAIAFVSISALGIGTGNANGQTKLLARMNNFNEPVGGVLGTLMPTTANGDPRPASFGTAIFELNAAMTAMTMRATVHNIDFTGSQTPDINDNLTVAHIHGSATATPTTTAGVIWGFFGMPFNDTMPNDQVVTPFSTGVGGVIEGKWDAPEGNAGTNLAAQLDNILNGRTYINFHTSQFGAGEIRGHLLIVPEPGISLLAIFALAGAFALRRKRQ